MSTGPGIQVGVGGTPDDPTSVAGAVALMITNTARSAAVTTSRLNVLIGTAELSLRIGVRSSKSGDMDITNPLLIAS